MLTLRIACHELSLFSTAPCGREAAVNGPPGGPQVRRSAEPNADFLLPISAVDPVADRSG
jgi:hypothetical protein